MRKEEESRIKGTALEIPQISKDLVSEAKRVITVFTKSRCSLLVLVLYRVGVRSFRASREIVS